ncbi:hypothetical protein A3C23_02405 [Candidatus Roizmanbacteria bacterium RIFCSPHIGHO2_02_FULL_37_13b]|uniref:EamA domain-containing protein n=1 Tax=Candidatus Roizmanbacteria bacterium RIFCSPLOWO2_02_FULL_36_11 TaxID=1802071 RepID=A0A1F7JIR8_9BACT|nr:MAG: hypothetical protein A3C23_02405 [Candidatus Roizmanbacteria bacterium RIFCSPHIGHO2_02_FULL_37_13b]OGK55486.1 MAG: hypothetical protein A3H78_04950 [Candidatus Roizmanbacteria bacterium RIFCSPLOWO2_02_FULL_36_11]
MATETIGLIYILISQICWGLAPKTIKLLSPTIPASMIVFIRFIMASSLLFSLIIIRNKTRKALFSLTRKQLALLVGFGLIGSGFPDLFFIYGIRHAGSIIGIVLARLEIPLTVLLAAFLLKEKLNRTIIMATILSFFGVLLISFKNSTAISISDTFYLGVIAAIVAAFIWAYTNIYGKKLLSMTMVPIIIVTIRLFIGAMFNLGLTLMSKNDVMSLLMAISFQDWLKLLFLGFFSSAVGYYTFYKGLGLIKVQKAAILLSGAMVIAVFVGLITGESLSILQWFGVLSIFTAIILINRK